jgi:hypothetical protein
MKASDAFPSKYIAAADLQDNEVTVKITHVTTEEIGNKQKFICYFAGKKKGLVLNKTNWNSIVRITGMDDSDDWTGLEICLFPTMVDFQGDSVPAVRVKPPRKQPAATNGNYELKQAGQFSTGGPRTKPPLDEQHGDPLDNEAPF